MPMDAASLPGESHDAPQIISLPSLEDRVCRKAEPLCREPEGAPQIIFLSLLRTGVQRGRAPLPGASHGAPQRIFFFLFLSFLSLAFFCAI